MTTLTISPTLAQLGLGDLAPAPDRLALGRLVSFSDDVALLRPVHEFSDSPREMLLPRSEFYPDLAWAVDETYVVEVLESGPRPLVTVNRPSTLIHLAQSLVPAARSGHVRVMAAARQPGVRAKLAVAATVEGIDPIAAVLGRAAHRVARMHDLLHGERVDVVLYDEDPTTFLRYAFAPAAVLEVRPSGPRTVDVVVAPHQMAAAVGGGGLNAVLAGRLCGVHVTVVSA